MNRVVICFLLMNFLSFAQSKMEIIELIDNSKFEGKIYRIENFKTKYIKPRTVDIWVPTNYSKDKKYSVLYMHDGQMLFDATTTWNKQEWMVDDVLSKLTSENEIDDVIVVAIWNIPAIRHADLFPKKPLLQLTEEEQKLIFENAHKLGYQFNLEDINSDNYLKFIVKEVKPFVDSNFSVFTDADHTAIMGSSMGGLISMYAICEYPKVFSKAACLSTHWIGFREFDNNPIPESFFKYISANLPDPKNHKIYFDYGTETLDASYLKYEYRVDETMKAKGYNHQNSRNLKFEGENHSEASWQKRINIPLEFMFGK